MCKSYSATPFAYLHTRAPPCFGIISKLHRPAQSVYWSCSRSRQAPGSCRAFLHCLQPANQYPSPLLSSPRLAIFVSWRHLLLLALKALEVLPWFTPHSDPCPSRHHLQRLSPGYHGLSSFRVLQAGPPRFSDFRDTARTQAL